MRVRVRVRVRVRRMRARDVPRDRARRSSRYRRFISSMPARVKKLMLLTSRSFESRCTARVPHQNQQHYRCVRDATWPSLGQVSHLVWTGMTTR